MEFFIPHLRDDPEAAEQEWERYLRDTPAPEDSRRVHTLIYHHDGEKYVATVGEQRKRYGQKTGTRGGRIKDAPLVATPLQTGTVISGIIDTGALVFVWSYAPFGGWANPSLVGRSEIDDIEYFDI